MTKRLFAAIKIEPGDAFFDVLGQLQRALAKERIKWVDPKQVHITLKFFGPTHIDRIPDICKVLRDAALNTGTVNLDIERIGIFGSRYEPRVIWFGIHYGENLMGLYERIRNGLIPLGYQPDRQNFVPHLTMARIRDIQNGKLFQETLAAYKDRFIQSAAVNGYHLYESRLSSYGAEYTILETFGL